MVCLAVATLVSGCLVKEQSETWYIDAAGGVTWVVAEKDVRSDANTAADRQQEESIYWLAVQQDRHPAAGGLMELGGEKVKTTVLRAESPFIVQTEAKFSGLDALGQRLIAAIGSMGTSIVTRDGQTWDWTMVVRDPSSVMGAVEPSENIGAVLGEGFDTLRVVLVAGRFEKAEGFTLSRDRRVATFEAPEFPDPEAEHPTVTLTLVWTTPER
jgi:hypothetical protein